MTQPYKPRRTSDWRRSYADSYFTGGAAHLAHSEPYGRACHICGVETQNQPTDHIFPISLAGITVVGNLAVACTACKIGRGEKSAVRYVIERIQAKKPVRYPMVDEYITWLNEYMEPYKTNYPREYSVAEAMVNDRRELRTNPREDFLKELINYRWSTIHDPITLRELGVPPEYEDYWKRIHMHHPELYFPAATNDPKAAYERHRSSNDPKWLRLRKVADEFDDRDLRNSYYSTAEVIFADIETMGYDQAFKHWSQKHQTDNNKMLRSSIAAALQAARPPRKSFLRRVFNKR